MVRRSIALLVALALLAVGIVAGQDAAAQTVPTLETSGLLIYDVWVRPTAGALSEGATPEPPIPGTVTGAFMTIENTGDAAYQLVGVESDAAEMSHIHETTSSGNMSGMRMIRAIDIPAGETVRLESGGYHAMLMNVIHDITPGEAVALTLTFADADGATFDVPVAGLATDLPPEPDALIVANALGTADVEGGVDVALILDNRAEQDDSLVAVSARPAATIRLFQLSSSETAAFTRVEVPAEERTAFAPDTLLIRLSEFAGENVGGLPPAVALTLSFDSGRELTVAVPVTEGAP